MPCAYLSSLINEHMGESDPEGLLPVLAAAVPLGLVHEVLLELALPQQRRRTASGHHDAALGQLIRSWQSICPGALIQQAPLDDIVLCLHTPDMRQQAPSRAASCHRRIDRDLQCGSQLALKLLHTVLGRGL